MQIKIYLSKIFRASLFLGLFVLLTVLFIGSGYGLIKIVENRNQPSQLRTGRAGNIPDSAVDSAAGPSTLKVNAHLDVMGQFYIAPSILPETARAGTLAFDQLTGSLTYHDGNGFVRVAIMDDLEALQTPQDPQFPPSSELSSITSLPGHINVQTTAGAVSLSLPQTISTSSTPTFAAINLASPLDVSDGGTGSSNAADARTSLGAAASGVNADITATTTLNTVTPSSDLTLGTAGELFILQGSAASTIAASANGFTTSLGFATPVSNSTLNFPALPLGSYEVCTSSGNCVGGGGGAPDGASYLTLGLAGDLSSERILSSGTNISFADGGANGNLTISTVGNPTFSTSVTTPSIQSTGALNIVPGGALTVGATTQQSTLQGTSVGITSNGAGNDITLTSADQIILNAADTIQLQDSTSITGLLSISSLGTADTASYLCRNSSNQIATCATSGSGIAFTQGGNSFGADAVLGTNDVFGLSLETSGVTRFTVSSAGAITATGAITAAGFLCTNCIDAAALASNSVGASELASTTVVAASYGSATEVGTFTVDADGRLTAAGSSAINIALGTNTTGNYLLSATAGSGLTSSGTAGEGWTVTLNVGAGTCISVATDTVGVTSNCINDTQVQDNSLTAASLAADSVAASEITAGAVGTSEVSDNTLTASDLAADSVGDSELQNTISISSLTAGTLAVTNNLSLDNVGVGISSIMSYVYIQDSLVATGSIQANGRFFAGNVGGVGTANNICYGSFGGSGFEGTSVAGFGACSSLSRYKDSQTDLSLGLETIRQLTPREFDWNTQNGRHDLGFIAEEVEAISPLLATYDVQTGALEGVKYTQISALLTKGVQQLDVQVQTNGYRLNSLEERIAMLENRNSGPELVVSSSLLMANLSVSGVTTLSELKVSGSVELANIKIGGHVLGNSDTRGTVVVPAGQVSTSHSFKTTYESSPYVVLTPVDGFSNYQVKASKEGFVVTLEGPLPHPLTLNYMVQQ